MSQFQWTDFKRESRQVTCSLQVVDGVSGRDSLGLSFGENLEVSYFNCSDCFDWYSDIQERSWSFMPKLHEILQNLISLRDRSPSNFIVSNTLTERLK